MEELKVSPFETFNTDDGLIAININRIAMVRDYTSHDGKKRVQLHISNEAGHIIVNHSMESVLRLIELKLEEVARSESRILWEEKGELQRIGALGR